MSTLPSNPSPNASSTAASPRPTRRELLSAGGAAAAGLALGGAVGAVTIPSAAASLSMRLGINGHALNSVEYNANPSSIVPGVPYSTQMSMLQQLGMQTYRHDIQTDASGLARNHPKLLNLYSAIDGAGLELFPMFYDNFEPTVSEADNYDRGFAKGVGLATNYGHMFTHCNLGNEWELSRNLLKDDVLGDDPSHYRQPQTDRAMHWIRGANDGMKSVKPDALTSVAVAGWFPVAWQDRLLDDNVDLDFVDWHWYSEMQPNIGDLDIDEDSILDHLWNRYELPIWVTETNSRSKEYPSHEQERNENRQVNWFNEWYAECFEHPHCEGMLVYELLDEPLHPNGYQQRNFGLVKFPDVDENTDPEDADFSNWEWKQLGRQLAGLDHEIGHFGSDSEGWVLKLGLEFPGAQGTFVRERSDAVGGNWSGVVTGDFSGGGNYVELRRPIGLDLSDLRLWAKSGDLTHVALRIRDSTLQYHQQRIALTPDNEWHPLHVSSFDSGPSYHFWDGANDGVWHGPATRVALLLDRVALPSGQNSGEVRFDSVIATVPN